MGLPRRYVEGIFAEARVDPRTEGRALGAERLARIRDVTTRAVGDVVSGNHDASVSGGEAMPVRLGGGARDPVPSFMEGLDRVFTAGILERGSEARSGASRREVGALESRLSEQRRALEAVAAKSASISRVANSLYGMAAEGIPLGGDAARGRLAANGARLAEEKGVPLMVVEGEKIRIDPGAPLQSVASALFDAAKRQSGASGTIGAAIARTEAELGRARGRAEEESRPGPAPRIRRRAWYERYRWFRTSDGMLAVGGRDAPSNSAVVRKHMEAGDRVFHADIFGSPFFVLKGARELPARSAAEAAHATVCFSRAWREGLHGVGAYWVDPGQVRRSAPSGEYLPKGSFTIEGRRNFVKTGTLRLAVGLVPGEGGHSVACGPPEPVIRDSACYAVIEPGGMEMADAAKRVRAELSGILEGAAGAGVDEFVRALPAGRSQVRESGRGGA